MMVVEDFSLSSSYSEINSVDGVAMLMLTIERGNQEDSKNFNDFSRYHGSLLILVLG